jgi:hypothetical protein
MYFEIMRKFWDFCFKNPEKINPNHVAIFCFIVEHCNRLGWKEKFGLPTMMACEAVGIKSVNTYSKAFNELVKMGLIKMIQKSKNQWSANVIAISFFKEANEKALDIARVKHASKHADSTCDSTDTIIRHNTLNQESGKHKKKSTLSLVDIPSAERNDKIRQLLSTTSIPEASKELYIAKIESNSYLKKQGGEFVPITTDSVRADAEYNYKSGWLNTEEAKTNQHATIGGYWK